MGCSTSRKKKCFVITRGLFFGDQFSSDPWTVLVRSCLLARFPSIHVFFLNLIFFPKKSPVSAWPQTFFNIQHLFRCFVHIISITTKKITKKENVAFLKLFFRPAWIQQKSSDYLVRYNKIFLEKQTHIRV